MNKTIHCKTCAGAFDSINVKADTFCKCKYCGVENYIDAKYNVFLDKPKYYECKDPYMFSDIPRLSYKNCEPVIIQTTQSIKNLDKPKNNIKASLKSAIGAFVVFDIINNFCRKK